MKKHYYCSTKERSDQKNIILNKLKSKNMNGLLSMIGMKTELDYLMGDFAACFRDTPLAISKGSISSDKQKYQPKKHHEFTIKGIKIMAASKKDAIKNIS